MYADVDFFLALLKEKDWLKENAEKVYKKCRNEIWTSSLVLEELMLYAYREKLDASKFIDGVLNLVKVKKNIIPVEDCLAASYLMKRYKLTPFDALHAIISKGDSIISSDNCYDRIGVKRIKLEEH